jgi:ribosomal protein S18 acetylase RimI-like enzyme
MIVMRGFIFQQRIMKSSTLQFSKVEKSDLHILQSLSIATYSDTFSADNTDETMQLYLDKAFSLSQLSNELSNEESTFYFAKMDEKIVGYLKLNVGKAQNEFQDHEGLEIERIYVTKEAQRQGIGKQLLSYAIQTGKELNKQYVWLGVWEKNEKAIGFYTNYGFQIIGSHPFQMGEETQTDLLMRLRLHD